MNKCCVSQRLRQQNTINKQIDDELTKEQNDVRHQLKFVLLGNAGSGKTTFMKQMKIRYGSGYSTEEKQTYTQHVYKNILDTMKVLCGAMLSLDVEYGDPVCERHAETILQAGHSDLERFVELYSTVVRTLWADSGVQYLWTRRAEFRLLDSAGYFLSELDRLFAPDYLPSVLDILRVDIPTDGVDELQFSVNNYTKVRMVDIGESLLSGACEKWMHKFHDYQPFLFVDINDCEPVVLNSKPSEKTSHELPVHSNTFEWFHQAVSDSALDESISLYRKVMRWYPHEKTVILLNKRDLLGEKELDTDAHFPEFTEIPDEGEDKPAMIKKMIQQLFLPSKRFYNYYFTPCVTDPDSACCVFTAVKQQHFLRRHGRGTQFQALF